MKEYLITTFIVLFFNIIYYFLYKNTYDGYGKKKYKLSRILFIFFIIIIFIPIFNIIFTFIIAITYDYDYPNKIIFKNKTINKVIEFLNKDIFYE